MVDKIPISFNGVSDTVGWLHDGCNVEETCREAVRTTTEEGSGEVTGLNDVISNREYAVLLD